MILKEYNDSSFLIDERPYQRGGYRFDFNIKGSDVALWDKSDKKYIFGFTQLSNWKNASGVSFSDRSSFELYYRDFFFESKGGGGGSIPDGSVTFNKIQDINTERLLGRYDLGSGQVQEILIGNSLQLVGDTLETNISVGGWDGEANTRNDLPIAIGNPSVGSIYVVLQPISTTVLGIPYKTYQSGLYLRNFDNGNLSDWSRMNVKTQFNDSEFKVANINDTSKQVKLDSSQITSGNIRELTVQDKNYVIADINDITITDVNNVGTGVGVFKQISNKIAELRTILGIGSINVSENGNNLEISLNPQSGDYSHSQITLDDGTNPHGTTKSDVGLGNVDNVQQIPNSEKGVANGVPTLDGSGKIPSSQLPNGLEGGISVIGFWNASTNTPNLNTTTANQGEAYQVSVAGSTSVNGESNWGVRDLIVWSDSLSGNWFKINSTDDVLSVNGNTGAVVIDKTDIGLGNVDNIQQYPNTNPLGFETPSELDARDTANRNRSNHTGTQTASTISDFDTEVSNNSSVVANTSKVSASGSVTTHSDVTSAGSGEIITSDERSKGNRLNSSGTRASTATLTPNIDNNSYEEVTAQAQALTVASPTGTPFLSQKLIIRIKDNGTARAITWNSVYNVVGVDLPVTTTSGKTIYVGCIYDSSTSNWNVWAVKEE